MRHTHSPLLGLISAALMVTSLRHLCTMCFTNSSLHSSIGTPLKIASFLLCSMGDTNSTLLGLVGTSLKAALLHLCAMRDTDSSLNNYIGTSLSAASFQLCAMCDTHSHLSSGFIGTSLEATSFCLSAMSETNASPHGLIDTSFMAATLFRSSPYAGLETQLGFFDDQLFLEYRLFQPRRDD
jgi:hypothetical protein